MEKKKERKKERKNGIPMVIRATLFNLTKLVIKTESPRIVPDKLNILKSMRRSLVYLPKGHVLMIH